MMASSLFAASSIYTFTLPSIDGKPMPLADFKGKVVLMVNVASQCGYTPQYTALEALYEKYKDQGLVVIGVHAPEFAFEKNIANVRWAVRDMKVDYPVAVDNDHVIWRAFRNQAWPALFFVDAQGRVRHHYFGEGAYEQSEMMLQQLLAEAGIGSIDYELVSVDAQGAEAAAYPAANLYRDATDRRQARADPYRPHAGGPRGGGPDR